MQRRYDKSSNLWGSKARLDEQERARQAAQAHQDTKFSIRLGQMVFVFLGIVFLGGKLSASAEEPDEDKEGEVG